MIERQLLEAIRVDTLLLHRIAGETFPVEAAYALAIARQESEFFTGAASSAGGSR